MELLGTIVCLTLGFVGGIALSRVMKRRSKK